MLNDPYSGGGFRPRICYEPLSIGAGLAAVMAGVAETAGATIAGAGLTAATTANAAIASAAGLALPYGGASGVATLAGTAATATGVGSVVSTAGTLMAGGAAKASADYRAEQLGIAATESRAAAQRQAFERRRQAKLTLSSLQSRAAAFSGDATNPGIVSLAGDIAQRGEYLALSEMYLGENRARGLEDEATGTRLAGSAARRASFYSSAGTLASGFGSMLKTYAPLK